MVKEFIVREKEDGTKYAERINLVQTIIPCFNADGNIKEYDLDIPGMNHYLTITPAEYDDLVEKEIFPKLV